MALVWAGLASEEPGLVEPGSVALGLAAAGLALAGLASEESGSVEPVLEGQELGQAAEAPGGLEGAASVRGRPPHTRSCRPIRSDPPRTWQVPGSTCN